MSAPAAKRSKSKMPVQGRTPSFSHMKELPPLKAVNASYRTELFIQKCQTCEKVYKLHPDTVSLSVSDFMLADDHKRRKSQFKKNAAIMHIPDDTYVPYDNQERNEKEKCLEDILRFFSSGGNAGNHKPLFKEECYVAMMRMVSANILRCPPLKKMNVMDITEEEDEPNFEHQWPHLVLVYGVFQKFVESPDFQPAVAKKYWARFFLSLEFRRIVFSLFLTIFSKSEFPFFI